MVNKKNKIHIIDVTNRDGVQAPRLSLAKLQKTIVNLYLDELGIFQSEMGFPFSVSETNYINANLELVRKKVIKNLRLAGWCRAIKGDVEKALKQTAVEYLNLSIPTSETMLKLKFKGKYQFQEIIEEMTKALQLARKMGTKDVAINAEDASRSDLDFLVDFGLAAKRNGASRLRYCDTIGIEDPQSIYGRVKLLAVKVGIPMEIHCHNDLGMAVACSLTGAKGALDGGQDAYINTTITGIGERAGNADLVSILLALKYARGFRRESLLADEINLRLVWKLTKYVFSSFGVPIPLTQPGVSENMFTHESGIHADGVLKNRKNYELYGLRDLGRKETEKVDLGRRITVGEYSGLSGFKYVYQQLGIVFKDEKEAESVLQLVRFAGSHTQKPLIAEELLFIAKYPEIARKLMRVDI